MRDDATTETIVHETVLYLDQVVRWNAQVDIGSSRRVMFTPAVRDHLQYLADRLGQCCNDTSDLDEARDKAVDVMERERALTVLGILGDVEIQRRTTLGGGDVYDGTSGPTDCPVCEQHHGTGHEQLKNNECVVCTYRQGPMGYWRQRDIDLNRALEGSDRDD